MVSAAVCPHPPLLVPELAGRDTDGLATLRRGLSIGSAYNYMPHLYHRLIRAFEESDLETARREQTTARRIIQVVMNHGGLPAGKALMSLLGLPCGPVRLPLRALARRR